MSMDYSKLLKDISKMMDEKLDPINKKLDEQRDILRALEDRADVSSAEIAGIKKSVSRIEKATADNWSDLVDIKAKIS